MATLLGKRASTPQNLADIQMWFTATRQRRSQLDATQRCKRPATKRTAPSIPERQ